MVRSMTTTPARDRSAAARPLASITVTVTPLQRDPRPLRSFSRDLSYAPPTIEGFNTSHIEGCAFVATM